MKSSQKIFSVLKTHKASNCLQNDTNFAPMECYSHILRQFEHLEYKKGDIFVTCDAVIIPLFFSITAPNSLTCHCVVIKNRLQERQFS